MGATSERLDVRGIEIGVHRAGRGEPLLYLHSASAESTTWNPAFEALAAEYDVIAPVHPGFPGSGGLERIQTSETSSCTTSTCSTVCGSPRLTSSARRSAAGSRRSWRALYPERVGSLVLVGAAGLWMEGAPMVEVFGVLPGQLAERLFYDQRHPMAQMLHAAGETSLRHAAAGRRPARLPSVDRGAARVAWNPYFHNPP